MGFENLRAVDEADWPGNNDNSAAVDKFRSEIYVSHFHLPVLPIPRTEAPPVKDSKATPQADSAAKNESWGKQQGEQKAPAEKTAAEEKPSAKDDRKDELPTLILLKEQKTEMARKEQIDRVASELSKFIRGADKTLDIAIYHFHLTGSAGKQVVDALNDRAENGVKVRLAIFQPEKKKGETAAETVLPALSPKVEVHRGAKDLNSNLVEELSESIDVGGIRGRGRLMHHKYIVRDGGTDKATVWTGSTNFTDGAFGSQDNNIIQLKSKDVASVYGRDFQQLWEKGEISRTGKGLYSTFKMGDGTVSIAFSPGDGALIDKEIAKRIEAANKSVHIASMDISSQLILKALAAKIDAKVPVTGVYDGPQMAVIERAWGRSASEASREKLELWSKVKDHLVGKHSKPYRPGEVSNFMHNKTVEIDESVVITGSFNLSSNATHNAENIVVVSDPRIAKQYSTYINDLVITYGGMDRKKGPKGDK